MGDVTKLPVTEKCTLCGDDPASIYAEMDCVILYRDEPNERYHAKLRVCIRCSDFLTISRETVKTVAPAPTPMPRQDVCSCGAPAVIRTAQGLKCADCAFR